MSTMRNGDPLAATRGAVVRRAKQALGDAIDKRLEPEFDRIEYELLASVIGCSADAVPARLNKATLGELQQWREAVENDVTQSVPNCATTTLGPSEPREGCRTTRESHQPVGKSAAVDRSFGQSPVHSVADRVTSLFPSEVA